MILLPKTLKETAQGARKLASSALLPVTQETLNRREICNKCTYLTSNRQCKLCTCFVDAKSKDPNEHCPLKKW